MTHQTFVFLLSFSFSYLHRLSTTALVVFCLSCWLTDRHLPLLVRIRTLFLVSISAGFCILLLLHYHILYFLSASSPFRIDIECSSTRFLLGILHLPMVWALISQVCLDLATLMEFLLVAILILLIFHWTRAVESRCLPPTPSWECPTAAVITIYKRRRIDISSCFLMTS